jgi:hypothetical protein
MKHDYAWDRSGPADPFIARLEATLSEPRKAALRSGRRSGWRRAALPVLAFAAAAITAWCSAEPDPLPPIQPRTTPISTEVVDDDSDSSPPLESLTRASDHEPLAQDSGSDEK